MICDGIFGEFDSEVYSKNRFTNAFPKKVDLYKLFRIVKSEGNNTTLNNSKKK
jgi:hypothetical protein